MKIHVQRELWPSTKVSMQDAKELILSLHNARAYMHLSRTVGCEAFDPHWCERFSLAVVRIEADLGCLSNHPRHAEWIAAIEYWADRATEAKSARKWPFGSVEAFECLARSIQGEAVKAYREADEMADLTGCIHDV